MTVQNEITARIKKARTARSKLDADDLEPLQLNAMSDALCIAADLLGEAPAAWKLGGSNTATRAIFNVNRPYFGPLRASEVFESGAVLNRLNYPAPMMAEPEIAVAFNRDFAPTKMPRSLEDITNALAWVAPAIELPATVLANPPTAGVNWLVADRCAAGALTIGPKLAPSGLSQLEQADITLTVDGAPLQTKQNDLIGGVLGSVQEMLTAFGDYNLHLPKDVIVATGGLTPAISVQDIQILEVRFGENIVNASFST